MSGSSPHEPEIHPAYSPDGPPAGIDRVLVAGIAELATPIAVLELRRDLLAAQAIAPPANATMPPAFGSMIVVWANRAALEDWGHDSRPVVGESLGALAPGISFLSGTWEIEAGLSSRRPVDTEVRGILEHRDSADEFAYTCTVQPLAGATARGGELWMMQLSGQGVAGAGVAAPAPATPAYAGLAPATLGADADARVIADHQSRRALAVLARISEYLIDVDRLGVLTDICGVLQEAMGGWFGFYLRVGDALEYVESLATASSEGTRAVAIRAESGLDALGDPHLPGMGTRVIEGPEITEVQDPVRALLLGKVGHNADFILQAAYMPGTVSRELAQDVGKRLPNAPGREYGNAVVYALPGRAQALGVLVAVMPGLSEETTIVGTSARVKRAAAWGTTFEDGASVLDLTARRVGMAVENAQLHRREHQVAEALQRSMLPEQIDVPGLDVWSYYAPASGHAQVGGDWFDVLQLDDSTAGIVIGDVVGHDIEAAATMGQLRSIIRAYAFELMDPAVVLARADRIAAEMRLPRPSSVVYGSLAKMRTGWKFEFARAGHLPPLVSRADGVEVLRGEGGLLVGYGRGARKSSRTKLLPGDAIVLYTDGLIERRAESLRDALEHLQQCLARTRGLDAAGIGEELLTQLRGEQEDDTALVIVRVPDAATGPAAAPQRQARRWTLPSESASIARVRHAVVAAATQWEFAGVADAELVASELAANAVLHGWGRLGLRVSMDSDGLRVEVEDSNPAPPVLTTGHANRAGGFGMRIVDRLATWGWEPSGSGKVVWAVIAHPA
ncbi:ATP-binding SpoIIE family protein phosphatase [Rarobacter incanus]|nr:ATP-binding SpoIIE family protein phosphatase [Rarobacter incanus]